jgi:small-conductance mechanosensitive channel
MTDHWKVIEDELQRSRDALAFACLSHNFTPPAIKVRCDKMDAALAFVREQRERIAELERELADVRLNLHDERRYTAELEAQLTGTVKELTEADEQLAAHPDAGEWTKIEGDIEGDDALYVQNGQLYAVTEYGEINIEFPAGYAVCRKQEGD